MTNMTSEYPADLPAGGHVALNGGPGLAPTTQKLLGLEVLVVLAVAILPSTATAVLSLVRSLLLHQTAILHVVQIPGHPADDAGLQSFLLAAETSAVLLVAYLLARSGESLGGIGLNAKRLGRDLGLALLLSAGFLLFGSLLFSSADALHVRVLVSQLGSGFGPSYLPTLLTAAARAGLLEEIVVCGYLLHRLNQLGWSDRKALITSVAVRASYHVYGGIPLVAFTLVFGAFLGRFYQRTNRLTAIVMTHAIYDAVVLGLYVAARH